MNNPTIIESTNETGTVMHNESTINYVLHLADNALILAQIQSDWCGHGPILEQDIAITNISLDILGQARNLYQYAALLIGGNTTEDSLAYLRTEREFKNCILVEQPNGDWANTILKLYLFSQFQQVYFQQLINSTDAQLAAIAEKSSKETAYHVRWSRDWVLRIGDGTTGSNSRMLAAITNLWKYTPELFTNASYESTASQNGIGVDVTTLQQQWLQAVSDTFSEATLNSTLTIPTGWNGLNGKQGVHTENMGFILANLQYLQRTYPGCEW